MRFERPLDETRFRDLGVPAAATYTHAGNFSFSVTASLVLETGARCAYENIWALETMAALALAGTFYREIPGVTFVHVDLRLEGLRGARSTKLFKGGAYVKDPREVEDSWFMENRDFPVGEIATDPRDATRGLLDRLFASFLGDADVVAELA